MDTTSRPVLQAVVATLEGGRYPTASQFNALLRELGANKLQARTSTLEYSRALDEDRAQAFIAQLRAFSLPE